MTAGFNKGLFSGILLIMPVLATLVGSLTAVMAAQETGPGPELTDLLWRKGMGRSIVVPPFVTPAGMVVTSTDSKIHLVDPVTGKRAWRRGFKAPIEIPPTWATQPGAGVVLVAFSGNRSVLRCLDLPSGKELWNLAIVEPAHQMEARGDRAWIIDRAGRLTCRRTDTGAILWSRETECWRCPGLLLTESTLFLLGRTDSLTALDPDQGRIIWSVPLTGRFAAPPAVAGGDLVIIDFDGRLLRFDPDSGVLLDEEQRARFQSNQLLELDGSVVSISDGGVVERDGGEGTAWRTNLEKAVCSGAVFTGKHLLVSGIAGNLQALQPDQGTRAWSMQLRGGLRVPPLLHEEKIILATGRGEIHVYSIPR